MRPALALVLALVLVAPARADDWSTGDTVRQAAVTALLVIDWGQTRYVAKRPDQCIGTGCLEEDGGASIWIGHHPSVGQVNNYFATSIIIHAGIAYVLPATWRHAWQYVYIGYEAGTVIHNKRFGVKLNF